MTIRYLSNICQIPVLPGLSLKCTTVLCLPYQGFNRPVFMWQKQMFYIRHDSDFADVGISVFLWKSRSVFRGLTDVFAIREKVISKYIADILELVPNRWIELKLDTYINWDIILKKTQTCFKREPVYTRIPARITICNHNHCRKNIQGLFLSFFCGSKHEGKYVSRDIAGCNHVFESY